MNETLKDQWNARRDAKFAAWMKAVDKEIAAKVGGLTSADLPDICYAELFEDGASPKSAAKQAIRYAKDEE